MHFGRGNPAIRRGSLMHIFFVTNQNLGTLPSSKINIYCKKNNPYCKNVNKKNNVENGQHCLSIKPLINIGGRAQLAPTVSQQ